VEVVKGVHLIETYANCALISNNRLVLIDTSVDDTAKDIFSWLRKNGHAPGDLTSVILTLTHPDHVLGLKAVKSRAPGAKVAAGKDDADYIARTKVYPGPPGPQRHDAVPVDVRLEDAQSYEGFLVIATPGHTPGHISLLDKERKLLVAGDALNNEKALGPMPDQYNIDPKQHRASIKKLANYEFETLIMGHGKPILRGAGAQVKALAATL
jgi:glyoxylase-like metal-dependent hydrolase (beta-lactamase superfamily II)